MKPSIYIFTTILLLTQLQLAAPQCTTKQVSSKRFFTCFYTSIYAPNKKLVTLTNPSYRNVTVSLTSSYIPTLSGNILLLTSGYTLIELTITRSKLQSIQPDTFTSYPRLEILNLSFNNVSSLENKMFNTSKTLLALNVSHNNVSKIGSETFFSTPLQSLDLSYNRISRIGNAEFKDLHFIKWLNLSYNVIKLVDQNVFEGVINLVDLDLKGNLIQVLPSCLMHLSLLTKLDLSGNLISMLNPGVFIGLVSLGSLDISFNRFETIPWAIFKETPALIGVNVKGNNISYSGFNLESVPSGLSVRNLTLGRNKLACDQLMMLLKLLKSLGINFMQNVDEFEEVNIYGVACAVPETDVGKDVGNFEKVKVEEEGKQDELGADFVTKIKSNLYAIYFFFVLIILLEFVQIIGCYVYGRRNVISRNINLGILE